MKNFKDWSIQTKFTTIVLSISMFCVMSLSATFIAQRYLIFKQQIESEFTSISKLIANRSNAAIIFDDLSALRENLDVLSGNEEVLYACTYSEEGRLLAQYSRDRLTYSCEVQSEEKNVMFFSDQVAVYAPITVDGQRSGFVKVSASTDRLKTDIAISIIGGLVLASLLLFLVLWLARRTQRFISDPLIDLAYAAERIDLDGYSPVPIYKKDDDEIGVLVDSFNSMQGKLYEQNNTIQKHTEELEQKVDERTAELQLSNDELKAFTYMLSHDLKGSVDTVQGFGRALESRLDDKVDKTSINYLKRVISSGDKLEATIESLTALTYANRSDINNETVNLTELANEIVQEMRFRDPQRLVNIDIDIDMITLGDESLLQIALENLIGNSWKYTSHRDESRIVFGQKRIDGRTVFFVKDNGDGFEMEYADQVLKPFKRLHDDSEFEGSGLGLATVERIITRHKGRLWFDSEVGKGSVFYFTLFDQSL